MKDLLLKRKEETLKDIEVLKGELVKASLKVEVINEMLEEIKEEEYTQVEEIKLEETVL